MACQPDAKYYVGHDWTDGTSGYPPSSRRYRRYLSRDR